MSRAPCKWVLALGLTLAASTGCTHTITRYSTVYCVTRAQYDELKRTQPAKIHDRLTGDAERDILVITANAIRLRAHDDGVMEVLGGCVDPKSEPDAHAMAAKLLKESK